MSRTRSEYRLRPVSVSRPASSPSTRQPTVDDRDDLAVLLLDAYRGTIDDEGEGPEEALAAITDGNVASERLFTRLGFTRKGRWG